MNLQLLKKTIFTAGCFRGWGLENVSHTRGVVPKYCTMYDAHD